MKRKRAREILEEIRIGRRYCRISDHFEEEALAEDFSIEDAWNILRRYKFLDDPEDRDNGMWRVRLEGETLDGRQARLVLDLGTKFACCYVTIHET